ncbi:single-stranded DNA-binding protein [Streptomyces sp. DSM 41524]|uniref:Single-stranded DNA-binding protein n=1 Tax=Streptomyces asiaticus subsp. ignotus TaxID=3098222 RepID=A0ABU7Q3B5_9ACTN|nr:single-stranded DNA-binding protein [Streptomyces sp. DSM 41524]
MAEREQHTFDKTAVAKALGAQASPVTDPAFGEGQRFQVRSDKAFLSLDTFPESGVSRITTKGARIELFGSSLPTVEDEGIVFMQKDADHEHSTVALHPDGALTFGYQVDTGPAEVPGLPDHEDIDQAVTAKDIVQAPAEEAPHEDEPAPAVTTPSQKPPEKPDVARSPGAFPDVRPMIHQAGDPEPATNGNGQAQPQQLKDEHPLDRAARIRAEDQAKKDAASEEAKEAEAQRVKLVGRLGRNPTFRTSAAGKLVGKFPLAVHLENGETAWHTILAFGDRAAALQSRVEADELIKGREVEVVGYLHEREYQGRDGTQKTAQEIYSVAVKRR